MIEFLTQEGNKSRINIERYPGGEYRIEGRTDTSRIAVVRGAEPSDLVVLAVWANTMRRLGKKPIAFIPYLPASRADHREHEEGFDAAAYAALINAANLAHVICVDPHSSVMPGLLERCSVIGSAQIVADHYKDVPLAGLIIPDEGAKQRVREVARLLDVPTIQAHKHRDFETGELSGFSCDDLPVEGNLLVVDDICDGGGTFRGLSAATGVAPSRLHLWVTHGIFSGHAYTLHQSYATVTTTDSHPGHKQLWDAKKIELLPYLMQFLNP